jgi:integrase
LTSDAGILPTVITRDNFHLSKPIRADMALRVAASNPISLSTDPEVLRFVEAATAKNTVRAYDSDLAHFLAWGGSIPADPRIVAKYFAAHSNMRSVATLARRVIAIRRAHALGGLPDPTKSELVRLTLRGVRRLHGRPQRRAAPLRLEHLADIVSGLGRTTRDLRDRALLLVGFAGAFRRSELVAIDCKWFERRERGIVITLPRSKTDQEGRGRNVAIVSVGGPICPVAALESWLAASGIADGPLFRPVSKAGKVLGDPLSAGAVATIVKQRVAQIGLDPQHYSGHSLRAGFATSAAAAGLPVWKIKGQTGHVSDIVVSRYIRDIDPFKGMATIWPEVYSRAGPRP